MLFGLKNRKSVVRFRARPEYLDAYPAPVPASKKMPDWFKSLSPSPRGQPIKNGTVKRCVPFKDAVTQGYIIPLWADLTITTFYAVQLYDENGQHIANIEYNEDENELIGTPVGDSVVEKVIRDTDLTLQMGFPTDKMTAPDGTQMENMDTHQWEQVGDACPLKAYKFGKNLVKLNCPWSIKTEKGWSVHFKAPAANFNSNIEILEGVVDTDEYTLPVNFPFVWKGDKAGTVIIPKGTPIIQVIPFKREKTRHVVEVMDEEEAIKLRDKFKTLAFDGYKKLCWHKRK
jgi:hypothetical protein